MNLARNVLALTAIFSGILVITSVNPVISVLFLISVFLCVAGYLILIGVSYIGLVYIIVYVGAIAILFLFVLMILNLKLVELIDSGKAYTQNLPLGSILTGLFFWEIISIRNRSSDVKIETMATYVYNKFSHFVIQSPIYLSDSSVQLCLSPITPDSYTSYLQIENIGLGLYTYSLLWLVLTSFILLVSIIGPIVLCINPDK